MPGWLKHIMTTINRVIGMVLGITLLATTVTAGETPVDPDFLEFLGQFETGNSKPSDPLLFIDSERTQQVPKRTTSTPEKPRRTSTMRMPSEKDISYEKQPATHR